MFGFDEVLHHRGQWLSDRWITSPGWKK